MAFQCIILCAVLAIANAGFLQSPISYAAAPALTYQSGPAIAYNAPQTVTTTYHGVPNYAAPAIGYSASAPALTSQSSNILRSYGNLGQISTYSKTIDTPFSSVRKADVRVSNPGLTIATAAPSLAYAAAPSLAYSAGPAIGYAHQAAPSLAYSAGPAIGYAHQAAPIGVAYSTAPAVSHLSYASPYATYGW